MTASKRIAIVQSSYIPWKGFFDMIASVDEFVLYDEVQYTRRDWRSRNQIKSPEGPRWLTIPVQTRGHRNMSIREIRVADPGWARHHWRSLCHSYAKAPCFRPLRPWLEDLYLAPQPEDLSSINHRFLQAIMDVLDIRTPLRWSSDYPAGEAGRSERLLSICLQAGAGVYLSGPAARDYLDVGRFEAAGVQVEWMSYAGYPEYPQLHGPFMHQLSVLDLLVHTGDRAPKYLLRAGAS